MKVPPLLNFFLRIKSYMFLFIALVFLLPTIFFGYTADDRQWVLGLTFANDHYSNSWWEQIVKSMQSMVRFFPLHIGLLTTAFHFFDYSNSWMYHLILLVMNLMAFSIFVKWVHEFFELNNKIWLILLLLASTQFRLTYNDPIVSNFGMFQVFAIFFFSGLLSLKRYFKSEMYWPVVWWGIFIMLQLMTYELALFMLPVSGYLIVQNWRPNKKKAKIALLFLVVIVVAYLVVYFILFQNTVGTYTGTTIILNLGNIFTCFIFEASGSLPLSYAAYLASYKLAFPSVLVWSAYIFSIGVIFALLIRYQKGLNQSFQRNKNAIIYGILIWFSAAASISLSSRYQEEILPGLSYAVVYMQNFGFAVIVFSLIDFKYILSRLFLVVVVILTFIMNVFIILENIKVDNAKRMTLKMISNGEIRSKYKFDYTVFNEKVFYTDDIFNKYFKINLGKPVYLKIAEISKTSLPPSSNIGLVVASVDIYKHSYVLIGRFNKSTFSIDDGTLITPSLSSAQRLAKQYSSGKLRTFKQNGETLYGFNIHAPVPIPYKLVGAYR